MEFKEKMMDSMMGRMSSEEKKQMMNVMMERFFNGITPEEKQEMMPKMMGLMMGGEQAGGGSPMTGMMGMMRSMMGCGNSSEEGFNPMEMCKQMMSTISNTSELATFATPEIRGLFEEWVRQVDEEVLSLLEKNNALTPEEIAAQLKISKESVIYFLSRLAQRGKVSLQGSKVKEK